MMTETVFSLEDYLSAGIRNLMKSAIRSTFRHPRQSLFFVRFGKRIRQAERIRSQLMESGEPIPPFLIASIAENCNLHCLGCYARGQRNCLDQTVEDGLTVNQWKRIFTESAAMGICFILLAGGEPLLKPEVLKVASEIPDILFPVFTNGTLFSPDIRNLFRAHPHLIPILSLEGGALATDLRRGKGTHATLMKTMDELRSEGVVFGVSVTITRTNQEEVLATGFLDDLRKRGCTLILYVEYVPIDAATSGIAFDEEARNRFAKDMEIRRSAFPELMMICFPGDEKAAGGCLAAGRGFFHINYRGDAEPCPFSPFSDFSLKTHSVREALNSPLFQKIRDHRLLLQEHVGGCVLFEKEAEIRKMAENRSQD